MTTPTRPPTPSPLRALLWKEWRLQRLLFIVVGAMALLILVVLARTRPFYAVAGAGLTWLMLVLLLGANTFSGEREDATAQFAEALPWARWKIFWVKTAIAAGLTLAVFVPLLALGIYLIPQEVSAFQATFYHWTVPLYILLFSLFMAAIVASFQPGVLTAFLMAPVLSAVGIAIAVYSVTFLQAMGAMQRREMAMLMGVFLVALLTLAIAASFLWQRPATRRWHRARRAVLLTGLYLLVVLGPGATLYARALFMSPRSIFPATSIGPYGRVSAYPSPDGRHIALKHETAERASHVQRMAITNTLSGETRWLRRYTQTFLGLFVQRHPVWSSDGNWLAVDTYGPFYPTGTLTALDRLRKVERFLYNPEQDVWQPLPQRVHALGWCEGPFLAISATPNAVTFLDPTTSEWSSILLPGSLRDRSLELSSREHVVQKGVIVCAYNGKDAGRPLACARFRPRVPEGELRIFKNIPPGLTIDRVSPDAAWMIGVDLRPRETIRHYILSFDEGGVRPLRFPRVPSGVQHAGVIEFTSDARLLLLAGNHLARYDIASDAWTVTPLPWATGRFLDYAWLRLSPGGRCAAVSATEHKSGYWGTGRATTITPTVIDLTTGEHWPVWPPTNKSIYLDWLTDDTLMALTNEGLWTLDRDGKNVKRLLP